MPGIERSTNPGPERGPRVLNDQHIGRDTNGDIVDIARGTTRGDLREEMAYRRSAPLRRAVSTRDYVGHEGWAGVGSTGRDYLSTAAEPAGEKIKVSEEFGNTVAQERDRARESLAVKLTEAGFGESTSRCISRIINDIYILQWDTAANRENLQMLRDVLEGTDLDQPGFFSRGYSLKCLQLMTQVLRAEDDGVASETKVEFLQSMTRLGIDLVGQTSQYPEYALQVALVILAERALWEAFGKDVDRIGAFVRKMTDLNNPDRIGIELLRMRVMDLASICEGKSVEEVVRNADSIGGIEVVINEVRQDVAKRLFGDGEVDPEYLQYLKSDRGWETSLRSLHSLFSRLHLTDVDEELLNRELLAKYIQRRTYELAKLWGLDTDDKRAMGSVWAKVAGEIDAMSKGELFLLVASLRRNTDDSFRVKTLKDSLRGNPDNLARLAERDRQFEADLLRVRRREDKRHPLNSLGLSRMVGYEVEFPRATSEKIKQESRRIDILYSTADLGFKQGMGGIGCDETSPGPFYDPKTAVLTFQEFVRAGIIDLYGSNAMTYHFNVSLDDTEGLHEIIWNMYLAGAAYDQKQEGSSFLRVYGNQSKFGEYQECKAFDLMTEHGFIWNFEAASYLAWALGAQQDIKARLGKDSTYRNELAALWDNHMVTLTEGLKSAGMEWLRGNSIDMANYERMNHEINKVLPDLKSRFDDPARVYESKRGLGLMNVQDADLREVQVDNRVWPNVVAFAREIATETVEAVEAVADQVEADVVADIREIESVGFEQKQKLIDKFVVSYGVDLPAKATDADKLKAYDEVKELFVDML